MVGVVCASTLTAEEAARKARREMRCFMDDPFRLAAATRHSIEGFDDVFSVLFREDVCDLCSLLLIIEDDEGIRSQSVFVRFVVVSHGGDLKKVIGLHD